MLTKVRISISLTLFAILALLVLPLVVKQTTYFAPLCTYTFLCLLIAMLLESSITFSILKALDDFKWINDNGSKPVFLFIKFFAIFALLMFIFISFEDINQVNPALIYMVFLPLLISNQNIYLGNHFIYSQDVYVHFSEIISYKRTTHKHYIQFILYTARGSHNLRFQTSQTKGIFALQEKLVSLSRSSD